MYLNSLFLPEAMPENALLHPVPEGECATERCQGTWRMSATVGPDSDFTSSPGRTH